MEYSYTALAFLEERIEAIWQLIDRLHRYQPRSFIVLQCKNSIDK